MSDKRRADAYLVESAANALRIIGLLRFSGVVTVTHVSAQLGVSKATAHRLLSTLVAEDFAVRDPVHRRYHLGAALLQVSEHAPDAKERARLRRPLEVLAARVGETVKLHVLEGIHVRSVEVVEGRHTVRVGAAIGELAPANATASGKILLCHESEEDLRARFGGKLPKRVEQTIVDWDEFVTQLHTVRKRKYAVNFSESSRGVNGISVAVNDETGQAIASLTVAAPSDRLTRDDHKKVLGHLLATSDGLDVAAVKARANRLPHPVN